MVIYKTTNLINKKIYIGQDSRNNPEYLGSGKKLQEAIRKFGKDKFKKEILEECATKEELCAAERKWIEKLDSRNPKIGYNLAAGGQWGQKGVKRSDETKQKLSESHRNQKPTEAQKRHLSKINTGKKYGPRSEETKQKMRDAWLQRKANGDGIKRGEDSPNYGKAPWNKGLKMSKEHCDKMSERQRGEKNNNFGKSHSKETKEKIRQSNIETKRLQREAKEKLILDYLITIYTIIKLSKKIK